MLASSESSPSESDTWVVDVADMRRRFGCAWDRRRGLLLAVEDDAPLVEVMEANADKPALLALPTRDADSPARRSDAGLDGVEPRDVEDEPA